MHTLPKLLLAALGTVTAYLAFRPRIALIKAAWEKWKGKAIVLRAANGAQVHILDTGGVIQRLLVPDKDGELGDVVLGFDSAEPYQVSSTTLLQPLECRRLLYLHSYVSNKEHLCANRMARRPTLVLSWGGARTALLPASSSWRRAPARALTVWPPTMAPITSTAVRHMRQHSERN